MRSIKQYHNYIVINFDDLVHRVNVDVINYYSDNNLQINKVNKDFKKIFVHFFIKELCTLCLRITNINGKILFCNPEFISNKDEMFEYVDYIQYINLVKGILTEIADILPVAIYHSTDIRFEDIYEKDSSNDLKFNFDYVYSKHYNNKSLRKLNQYAEKLGLNFLRKDLLNQINLHKIFI